MRDRLVSTVIPVTGVRDDDDVRRSLQALFDVFASQGLGQATFEITEGGTELFVKHKASVTPDLAVIDAVLRSAGDYGVAR